MIRIIGAIQTLPWHFCLVLRTIFKPNRNRAEAPKALPKVVKNPSKMEGNVPPNIKLPKIPNIVMNMMGFVHTDLTTFPINLSLEVEALSCCCLPISRNIMPMGFRMTSEIGANRYM